MKSKMKTAAAFLSAVMLAASCINVYAEDKVTKLMFAYPDGWEYTEKEDGFIFSSGSGSVINIYNTTLPDFDIMSADDDTLKEYLVYTNGKTSPAAIAAQFNVSEVETADIESHTEMKNSTVYREACLTSRTVGGREIYLITYMCSSDGAVYHFDLISDSSDHEELDKILDSVHFSGDDVPESDIEAEVINIGININGRRIRPDSAPELISGRTLVPIRAVAENLGYTVNWDAETRTVAMTKDGGNEIKITIDADELYKNSEKIAVDVPAQIIDSRTYLPLRAVAEAMDCRVEWDGENKIVDIFS